MYVLENGERKILRSRGHEREKQRGDKYRIDGKEASDTFSSSIGSFVSPLQNRAKRTLEKSRGCLGSLEASRSRLLITDSRRCYTPSFKITAVNSKKNRHVMANRSGRGSSPRRIREETRPDPPSPSLSLSLFDPCSNLVRIPTHKPLEVITGGRPRASLLEREREREGNRVTKSRVLMQTRRHGRRNSLITGRPLIDPFLEIPCRYSYTREKLNGNVAVRSNRLDRVGKDEKKTSLFSFYLLKEGWNHAFMCLPTLCNLIQDGKSMGGSYRRVKRKRMQIRYFRDDVTSKDFERNRGNRRYARGSTPHHGYQPNT